MRNAECGIESPLSACADFPPFRQGGQSLSLSKGRNMDEKFHFAAASVGRADPGTAIY